MLTRCCPIRIIPFTSMLKPQVEEMPDQENYDNAFKIQWKLFLKHVVKDEPFRWNLKEGAKGVQLAEKGLESWAKRQWIDVPDL